MNIWIQIKRLIIWYFSHSHDQILKTSEEQERSAAYNTDLGFLNILFRIGKM